MEYVKAQLWNIVIRVAEQMRTPKAEAAYGKPFRVRLTVFSNLSESANITPEEEKLSAQPREKQVGMSDIID